MYCTIQNSKTTHYSKVSLHLQIVNMIVRYKETISTKKNESEKLIEEWNLLPLFWSHVWIYLSSWRRISWWFKVPLIRRKGLFMYLYNNNKHFTSSFLKVMKEMDRNLKECLMYCTAFNPSWRSLQDTSFSLGKTSRMFASRGQVFPLISAVSVKLELVTCDKVQNTMTSMTFQLNYIPYAYNFQFCAGGKHNTNKICSWYLFFYFAAKNVQCWSWRSERPLQTVREISHYQPWGISDILFFNCHKQKMDHNAVYT